jgi:hypothetical protein
MATVQAGSRLISPTRQYAGVTHRGRAYYRGIIGIFGHPTARCQAEASWICNHQHQTQQAANACALAALKIVQEAR